MLITLLGGLERLERERDSEQLGGADVEGGLGRGVLAGAVQRVPAQVRELAAPPARVRSSSTVAWAWRAAPSTTSVTAVAFPPPTETAGPSLAAAVATAVADGFLVALAELAARPEGLPGDRRLVLGGAGVALRGCRPGWAAGGRLA